MQFSKKLNTFCCFFLAFVESTCNFEYFEENEPYSLNISEIIDSERRSYLNAKKVLFLKIIPQSTC